MRNADGMNRAARAAEWPALAQDNKSRSASNAEGTRWHKVAQVGAANLRKKAQSSRSFTFRKVPGTVLKKLTWQQLLHLMRRLLVIAATLQYIATSIHACLDVRTLLQAYGDPFVDFQVYKSKVMGNYAGNTTIRESPLVAALHGDTSPRNGTLFLEETSTSFMGCASTTEPSIYQDAFQRSMFASIADATAYNLTFLDPATRCQRPERPRSL